MSRSHFAELTVDIDNLDGADGEVEDVQYIITNALRSRGYKGYTSVKRYAAYGEPTPDTTEPTPDATEATPAETDTTTLLASPGWQTLRAIVDHLDTVNADNPAETDQRLLKLTEEIGEVAQARIGMTGQNPRKGITHGPDDVAAELCDVIITAAVALHSFTLDPAAALAAKLAKAASRFNIDLPSPEPIPACWEGSVVHPNPDNPDDAETLVCCTATDGTSRPIGLFLNDEMREALGLSLVDPHPEN
ncbi:MazG-like family protein [Streptomyces pseudogriseolus]|uniref:MazG-like family protein n=1 Tax=Streptomyces pseudogriseolus TaxID=36817 RepID=UPI003FA23F41